MITETFITTILRLRDTTVHITAHEIITRPGLCQ
jgi:hypothetical protein